MFIDFISTLLLNLPKRASEKHYCVIILNVVQLSFSSYTCICGKGLQSRLETVKIGHMACLCLLPPIKTVYFVAGGGSLDDHCRILPS